MCLHVSPICPRCNITRDHLVSCNPNGLPNRICRGINRPPPIRERFLCEACKWMKAKIDRLEARVLPLQEWLVASKHALEMDCLCEGLEKCGVKEANEEYEKRRKKAELELEELTREIAHLKTQ